MESASAPAAVPESWPVLDPYERRALGVLIEKAKTTPDAYPLSLNALVTGCNQKSNRDPVLNLSDGEVESALAGCRRKGWCSASRAADGWSVGGTLPTRPGRWRKLSW